VSRASSREANVFPSDAPIGEIGGQTGNDEWVFELESNLK
jgi:hypothetical protein